MSKRLAELAELRHRGGFRGWRGRRAWRRLVRAGDGVAAEAVWGSWLRERLAERAELRHRGGFRGWRGRRAWQRLVRAGDRGDGVAAEAMWGSWLREPGDEAWECLGRWWPEFLRDKVFATAVDPARPPGLRGAIGEFCARHDLAPDSDHDRVVFHVLTGQTARYQALDPDGALLAGAYRGASEATRTALRQAMVDVGEAGLVRVLADSRERVLDDDEFDYATRQLALAGEWVRLWRLVRDAPVVSAVKAVRLFEDWRPEDEASRELFSRMAAARPDVVAAAAEALARAASARVTVQEPVVSASFAPDRPEIAIISLRKGIDVFTVPGGQHVAEVPTAAQPLEVLHLGERLLALETSPIGHHRLNWYEGGKTGNLVSVRQPYIMAGAGGRFVVSTWTDLARGTAAAGAPVEVRGLPLEFHCPEMIAADPASGRIALAGLGWDGLVLFDENLRMCARGQTEHTGDEALVYSMAFTAPDRLVSTHGNGAVRQWRLDEDVLRPERVVRLPEAQWPHHVWPPVLVGIPVSPTLCVLPPMGCLAVVDADRVSWLDMHTLEPTGAPRGLAEGRVLCMWSTPDGERLAVARPGGQVDLHEPRLLAAATLATTPLAHMGFNDVAAVTEAERAGLAPELLGLLRACLEHRFATEIQLGTATELRGGADDIALG